jgi:Carboxypeptidase regulatory-like domain/Disulphide bond corrector protein DsbC
MNKQLSIIRVLSLLTLISIGTQIGFATQTVAESSAAAFRGVVVDPVGAGISDASILVERNEQSWEFRSDEHGRFKLSLPDGTFRFTIERNGFKKVVLSNFMIVGGNPSGLEFRMQIENPICTVVIQPALPATTRATVESPAPAADPQPNIGVAGYYASNNAQRGRTLQAAIVIDIPSGYHVNANRPLGKYAIPTSLKIEAPRGVTVGAVIYPRGQVRKLKAGNNEPLALYETKAILRFNVTVPADYNGGEVVLKARLRYQSCNDEVCFPPKSQEIDMKIGVVGPNDRVQRTNGWVFGGRK